ncbi:hypothetical protein Syun_025301 [Stephania yunnanensis]|uniref:TFIID subunit TAF5 NTD2 domain-containing protein n=1 Tax=Stephania yunnanensis TaxID=152371 RepID=A0AAP0ERF9_9MAGN
MEEEEIEKAVIAYLKKKGFKQTEIAFHEEHLQQKQQQQQQQEQQSKPSTSTSTTDPDLAKQILSFSSSFSETENGPLRYLVGYSKLRSWTYCSLDLYKHELLRVLYPVFIHCFMDLVAKGHTQGVSPGQPSSISDDAEAVTLVGSGQDIAKQINEKEIHWGLLEDSLEDRLEKAGGLISDAERAEGETKDGDLDEGKRSVDGGKQGPSIKKLKKDKVVGTTGKNIRSETNVVSMAPRVKADLTLPVMPTEVEQSILEDLRNRVQLNSLALPSVWDMTKLGQQADSSTTQGESEAAPGQSLVSDEGNRSYTLFQGHAGPVYSSTFSPIGDFILSSSSDSTVRLWSRKLNANLVCYKGHNYPVWDVQFSPVGHYFASASHDRTARVWSMDRIQPLRIMAGHLSDVDASACSDSSTSIQCVRWHANCNYIATGSSDKTVRLWDVQSGECVRIFIGHRSMILSLAMSPDGRYMASGDEDGTIMMWDLSSGRCVTPLMGHSSCVWTLDFSGEGSLLASGSADCTVKLWDVTSTAKAPKADEKVGSTNRLRSLKTLPTKSTPVYTVQERRDNRSSSLYLNAITNIHHGRSGSPPLPLPTTLVRFGLTARFVVIVKQIGQNDQVRYIATEDKYPMYIIRD